MRNALPLEGLPAGDGLFALDKSTYQQLQGRRGQPADAVIVNEPVPGADGFIRLDLPRWDTMWEAKKGRNGWPKVNPTTRKVIKQRRVWDALKGNARTAHFAQRHKAVREVIGAVVDVAARAGLSPCAHLTVRLVWAPGDWRVADDDNLWHLQKVCCDALARGPKRVKALADVKGLHLVPDDTRQYMDKLAPLIHRPPKGQTGPSGLWLEVKPE